MPSWWCKGRGEWQGSGRTRIRTTLPTHWRHEHTPSGGSLSGRRWRTCEGRTGVGEGQGRSRELWI